LIGPTPAGGYRIAKPFFRVTGSSSVRRQNAEARGSAHRNFIDLIVRTTRPVLKTRPRRLSAANVEADMLRIAKVGVVKNIPAIAIVLSLAVVGGMALAAQDRYTLKLGKLSFGDFKGYENWRDVAVSQTETQMKVIVANDVMMSAYRQGLPADGKLFPEGSKVVKIEWTFKKNPVAPYSVNVPDTLKAVAVIEKDTKRFPNTHGWAYGNFNYDAASDTFTPEGTDSECGFACHTTVAAKDYIFTAYPKR
jgi:hypothetical protein